MKSRFSENRNRFPNKHELSIIHTVSRRSWKYGTQSVSLNTSSRAQKLRWYSFWTSFCQDLPKKVDLGPKLSSGGGPNFPDRKKNFTGCWQLPIRRSYSIFRSIHQDVLKLADFLKWGGKVSFPPTFALLCTRSLSKGVIKLTLYYL